MKSSTETVGVGDETIAAIVTATAQDAGSVAIVRLSGRDALRLESYCCTIEIGPHASVRAMCVESL